MNKLRCLSPVGLSYILLFFTNILAVAIACFTEGIILPVIAILLSLLQLILYRQEERKRASEQSPSHPAGTDQEVPIPLYRLQQGSHIWN